MFWCQRDLLDFSNYSYSHKKYLVNPSCRNSSAKDKLSELELSLDKGGTFDFRGIFARAVFQKNFLDFFYINDDVVDGHHLGVRNLVRLWREEEGPYLESHILMSANIYKHF